MSISLYIIGHHFIRSPVDITAYEYQNASMFCEPIETSIFTFLVDGRVIGSSKYSQYIAIGNNQSTLNIRCVPDLNGASFQCAARLGNTVFYSPNATLHIQGTKRISV